MTGPTNPQGFIHSAVAQYTDGTAVAPGDITKYQYGFGQTSGTYTLIKDDPDLTTDANGKQVYLTPALPSFGQWFAATRAVTKDGGVAAWSNEVSFVTAPKVPKAVSDFSAV